MPLIQLRMQNLQTIPIKDGAANINEHFSAAAFAELRSTAAPPATAALPHCISNQNSIVSEGQSSKISKVTGQNVKDLSAAQTASKAQGQPTGELKIGSQAKDLNVGQSPVKTEGQSTKELDIGQSPVKTEGQSTKELDIGQNSVKTEGQGTTDLKTGGQGTKKTRGQRVRIFKNKNTGQGNC
jgi:hypothetical protein